MKDIKIYRMYIIAIFIIIVFYNLYFIFLVPYQELFYLYYADFLVAILLTIIFTYHIYKYKTQKRLEKELLLIDSVIYNEYPFIKDNELFMHDIYILEDKNKELYNSQCDLQDYITRWIHEVKIPLSTALLLNENIEQIDMRRQLKEQLERINLQLNSALVGCKVHTHLYDLQIKKVDLLKCIKTSIKNNRYFLIKKHFQIDLDIKDIHVYSDSQWLVYIFDQLISNAIKYTRENPCLKINAIQKDNQVVLTIEDNGEGIRREDIRQIFNKGFVGSNHHNGQYKSTGMGLYMAKLILDKLEHQIIVESQYQDYTRFKIIFIDNRDYFYLT